MMHWLMLLMILPIGALLACLGNRWAPLSKGAMVIPWVSWVMVYFQSSTEAVKKFSFDWIPSLQISLDFQLSNFSSLMLHLILGIGSFILIYSKGYFDNSKKHNRFMALALLFMFAMSGVVISDHLILTFIFWELTGILSFFLVAFYYEKDESRLSARRALIITTTGGLFLLAGMIMLGNLAQSYQISQIIENRESFQHEGAIHLIAIFMMIGCMTKSAQFPFHFWLPGAMAAPTPASAYLHSATMVKAGVFLLALLNPIFEVSMVWKMSLILIGGFTLLYGALQSIFCQDLKAILAYTTIAILGALTMLIGIGTTESIKAFLILIVAHALYKATLFMIAGIIDLNQGTRDLKKLKGLRTVLFIPALAGGMAALSMSGIPGTLGFLAKEYKYKSLLSYDSNYSWFLLLLGVSTSALMMYSAFQAGVRPFLKTSQETQEETISFNKLRASYLFLPPLILAFFSLVFGLIPQFISPQIQQVTLELSGVEPLKIKLWNGFNMALALSAITFLIGVLLWKNRLRIGMKHFIPHGTHSFESLQTKLFEVAEHTSNYLKNSSLKSNIILILITAMSFIWLKIWRYGGIQNLDQFELPDLMPFMFSLLTVVGAYLTCRSKRTSQAILFTSLCGIGTSMLFLYFGAPDLAITQISVDVLLMILFVAILSKMPKDLPDSSAKQNWVNIIISLMMGMTLSFIMLKSLSFQLSSPISKQFGEWSYTLAHGANVVNVILVDFRAMDTLGEISVLCIAVIGIGALSKSLKKSKEVKI